MVAGANTVLYGIIITIILVMKNRKNFKFLTAGGNLIPAFWMEPEM